MLLNRKGSWGTKVGMRGGNLGGKFELLFRVQTLSFCCWFGLGYFSFVSVFVVVVGLVCFVLKVAEMWDFETGKQLYEFTSARGETASHRITES